MYLENEIQRLKNKILRFGNYYSSYVMNDKVYKKFIYKLDEWQSPTKTRLLRPIELILIGICSQKMSEMGFKRMLLTRPVTSTTVQFVDFRAHQNKHM